MPQVKQAPAARDEAAALSKAVVRAATNLDINNKTLSAVLGLSEATASRLKHGSFALERGRKEFELGVLFVRLYRSLDAIVGGDEGVARAWLANYNTALQDKPISLIQTISGLTHVIQYLDARRAPV
jgi:hypothetical protein